MGDLSLQVKVNASRASVWRDFVDMMAFAEWWWPFDDTTYAADIRPGGAYRFASAGAGIGVHGEYRSVADGEHLEFSWQWEDSHEVPEPSVARVALADAAAGATTVIVTHQASDDELDDLRQGWEHCLQRLITRYA
ncbi:SRPBCC domain-containing protein [Microbacterium sp. NC79]|uniref:SRPBCC family protein n=1 Tax=Microbacterium sp. NC79 TaxID=2851009 RepID=UPI001C2C28D6|nr:SRPBCC domain-containing protein [Microbacterium sp. NC79]MBV0896075.1 SRPBCC domain-containing protein [Microbacterium sp. NC79]